MSWDAYILKFDKGPPVDFRHEQVDDDPPRFQPLGTKEQVKAAISAAEPAVKWAGLFCSYETSHFGIGLDLGGDEVVPLLWVNTNAFRTDEPSDPVSVLAGICKACGWSLWDSSTSEFLDLDDPSLEGWTGYVDLMKLIKADIAAKESRKKRSKRTPRRTNTQAQKASPKTGRKKANKTKAENTTRRKKSPKKRRRS